MIQLQVLMANWMNALAALLPFGYSFGAGMVSTVNPCGFSLLPAYLSLYLGGRDDGHPLRTGVKALVIGAAVTLGFTVLFSFIGGIVLGGGYILMRYTPWLGLLVDTVLALLGIVLLAGKSLHAALPGRIANMIGNSGSQGFKTYFLFGLGYGIASLGCTLPVFLVAVGGAMKSQCPVDGLLQFVSFSLGMGAVLTALTLSMAVFKGGLVTCLRKGLPYVGRTAGALLLLSGSYQIYYWLTEGILLR